MKTLRAALGGSASHPGELVGLEGIHLVQEALASGMRLDAVYVREGSEAVLTRPEMAPVRATQVVVLNHDVFDSAMQTASPQGIAATMAIPAVPLPRIGAAPDVFLLLEDVQDPGNVGTLLRSAEAFGVRVIYVTPATANIWNAKTMRASAGSVFRMPVVVQPLQEFAETMRGSAVRLLAAVAGGPAAVSLGEANLHGPCAIMIGNEGAGLSAPALALADERVRIPCAVESLNAAIAGSVILYEVARQCTQRGAP